MDRSCSLELAHRIPGRLRLRWLGSEALPSGLLSRLTSAREIDRVDYHPSSRSLVLGHSSRFDLEGLRALAGEFDIDVGTQPAAPAVPAPSTPPPPDSKRDLFIADLEAVLLVGLIVAWIRDLIISRTVRVSTLLLLILTCLNLYQFWQRRRQREGSEELVEPPPTLDRASLTG